MYMVRVLLKKGTLTYYFLKLWSSVKGKFRRHNGNFEGRGNFGKSFKDFLPWDSNLVR